MTTHMTPADDLIYHKASNGQTVTVTI